MDCSEIRSQFVDFYQERGFQLLPPASMLHPSIPMSFVMSAGLVQVETSLANNRNRPGNKFTLVQNCFRHFDLDTVGTDDIHLSLFEMPGAFVFGNNGKQQTIQSMWQLSTEKLGIEPNRIWASYFAGGNLGGQQLPQDELTRQTWLEIGLPETRLVGLGLNHNYWIQGDGARTNGESWRKCGTNTELFYDRGTMLSCDAGCQPGCKCRRFIEFSNSLFISHAIDPRTNSLTPIDDPFNETVIGTERVAMILQKVKAVFDIEIYSPLIKFIHEFIVCKNVSLDLIIASERVIADHLRALYVLVADGAPPPGKNGRERIIKLLIRGVLTRQIMLGIISKEFLSALLGTVIRAFDKHNVEAFRTEGKIKTYFVNEGRRFQKAVERGRREIEKMIVKIQGGSFSGSQVLFLEKNLGLPHFVAAQILQEKELSFPEAEYKKALKVWKQYADK